MILQEIRHKALAPKQENYLPGGKSVKHKLKNYKGADLYLPMLSYYK